MPDRFCSFLADAKFFFVALRQAMGDMDGLERNALLSILRFDEEHYLPDMLLRDLDGMTMSQSLEARAPLLDRELIGIYLAASACDESARRDEAIALDAVKDIVPPKRS